MDTAAGATPMQQLQLHQAQVQREQARINEFWANISKEMNEIDPEKEDFKTHELPLARIKKIMRLEDDVAESGTPRFMIAAEAPIIIAKACEIFVLEMAMRANSLTTENKRRTLQRNDIAMAVSKTDTYDFLIDIVPRDELKKEDASPSATVADLEAQQQQQMQLMAMQHLGAQMTPLQEQQLLQQQQQQQQQQAGAGGADVNTVAAQAALQQQQQDAIMAAVASNPQLAMQMQVLWQQHAQQAMILQHQQQQQQQRDGRAVGAEAAMGLQAGLGALGGQGEQSVDQTTAMIAMQNAMMANPSVLQAFMGSMGGAPVAGQQQVPAPPQQQQLQQQQQQQHQNQQPAQQPLPVSTPTSASEM